MTITIDITPDLEKKFREFAAQNGVDPSDCVIRALRDFLHSERRDDVPRLSAEESRLFEAINKGLSQAQWHRYHDLIDKRRAEEISDEEYAELVSLSQQIEQFNNRRLKSLSKLAKLRNTTLAKLMDDLGLAPPPVI